MKSILSQYLCIVLLFDILINLLYTYQSFIYLSIFYILINLLYTYQSFIFLIFFIWPTHARYMPSTVGRLSVTFAAPSGLNTIPILLRYPPHLFTQFMLPKGPQENLRREKTWGLFSP